LSKKYIHLELLLISTWFIGVMAVQFMLPLLPTIAKQLHASTTLVKYTISIFLFGKAFGMLAFGPLSEKYGRKIFMLTGLGLFTFGNLLALFSTTIEILLFARLIQGLGVSASVLIGRTMINDTYKSNKAAVVFSHIFLVASIIISFLPMLGSLMAMHFYWRTVFLIMGSYTTIIFVLCFFYLNETHTDKGIVALNLPKIFLYYKTIISHPLFLGYVLCSIFMIAGESAFNTASSFLLMQTFNVSTKTFGMLITLLVGGHLIGTLICGKLVKKHDLSSMMGVGVSILLISTLFMVLGIYLGYASVALIIIPMIIYHAGTGFIMTITAVGSVVPFPNLIGISSAASLLLNFTFSALSSAVVSNLSTHTAGPVSLLIFGCGVLAFFSWYGLILPNHDRKSLILNTPNI